MYTKIEIEQLCAEHNTILISIGSTKEKFSRETKVTIQCCENVVKYTVEKSKEKKSKRLKVRQI